MSSAIKTVFSKHVVLIMRIIILIIINMDDIRQERFSEGPILNLDKSLKQNSRNKKFVTRVKEFMVFKVLKK